MAETKGEMDQAKSQLMGSVIKTGFWSLAMTGAAYATYVLAVASNPISATVVGAAALYSAFKAFKSATQEAGDMKHLQHLGQVQAARQTLAQERAANIAQQADPDMVTQQWRNQIDAARAAEAARGRQA